MTMARRFGSCPASFVMTASLFVACCLGFSGQASADGLADEAELHFQLGTGDYQKGEYTSALEHFMVSNRLVPNRRVGFNIARTFEQLKRFPDAYRYYTDALEGETNKTAIDAARTALERLTPYVALLDVVTNPPGATIYIDRKDLGSRGRTPRALALAPGTYRVIVELPGYESASSQPISVQVGNTEKVPLELKRIEGRVEVTLTGAPHAAVRVDDEASTPVCTAPCEFALPVGKHELFVTADGVASAPKTVQVVAGQKVAVGVALRPPSGVVVVGSTEPGALVTIDGRPAGFTPAVLRDVPVGPRRVQISGKGYATQTRDIVVRQGGQVDLGVIDLVPQREVTAVSRYAERIDDAPSSVSVIDGREIAAFGYPTIAEALRGVRGLALSNDRVYASVSVRGIGQPNDYGSRLLVLSDGQALNDNLLNSSYIGSDGRSDLADIDRIEVVRGPGSLLYGAGAFAGVVNLVTRGRDAPNGVHVGVGTYDNAVLRGRGGLQWKFGQDKGIWASGWGAQSNGFDLELPVSGSPDPIRVRGVERFQAGGTAGRVFLGPATMQWYLHHRTQVSPVGAYATELNNARNAFADTRMMVEARYEPRISNSVQLLFRAHGNHYTYDGTYAFAGNIDNIEKFSGSWMGGEARLVYSPGPRFRLTVGGEGQWHPEATLTGTRHTPPQADFRYMNEKRPYYFGAGYALAEGSPWPWLRLSGGVRIDGYSTFGAVVVPRGAIIIKPSRAGILKIMGGRAFRAPSIYEQLYNDNGQSQEKALTLDAEKIVSGEIEYSHRFLEDWVALAAAHTSVADGIIETEQIPGKTTVRYANQSERILVIGADAELRREWRKGWMLAATYGYQRARYLDAVNGDRPTPNIPEHLGSVRFVVPILPTVASLGTRATVEAPRLIDGLNSTPMGIVADVTVSGELKTYGLRYVVGIYNVADRRYSAPVTETFASRTMPQNGRTFLVDLVGTFPP